MKVMNMILLLVLLIAPPTLAQRTIPMNIEALVSNAAMIFAGRVVDVKTGTRDPHTNLFVTYITFEVIENLHGVSGNRLTIKQYGGEAEGMAFYPVGIPRYNVGEEVVMLLSAPSSIGMQSPVGMEQGKFSVRRDEKTKKKIVSTTYGTQNLFKKLRSPEKVKRKAWLKAADPGALEYDDFVSTLRSLIPVVKKGK
jgi:hypothetical protein